MLCFAWFWDGDDTPYAALGNSDQPSKGAGANVVPLVSAFPWVSFGPASFFSFSMELEMKMNDGSLCTCTRSRARPRVYE